VKKEEIQENLLLDRMSKLVSRRVQLQQVINMFHCCSGSVYI